MSEPRFSFSQDHLRNLAADVLAHARSLGATDAEIDVSEGYGLSVTARMGEVENIEHNRDKGISVSVYLGQRKGYASSSDFSPAALRATAEAALNIARFTAADDCAGLADPALLAKAPADPALLFNWPRGSQLAPLRWRHPIHRSPISLQVSSWLSPKRLRSNRSTHYSKPV